jgi:ABC-type Fe3+/spermidine/putrescine transport system ATPase subunit
VAEPDVLLLDEPLSNLDASLREQMRGELRNLQQTLNVTTLYVTHDQAEALSMSDRIAVMRSGRFVEVASPEELYHHPKSVFTAGFIGGANIVPGSRQAGSSARGPTAIATAAGVFWSSDGSEGERATLFIRPEKIRILAGGSRGGEDVRNRFPAMVKSRRFGGESSEVEVIVEGPANPIVLRCKARGDSRLKAGERVEIVVDPDDVHILALA